MGGEDLLALGSELLDSAADGRIKLYLTFRALDLRRAHSQLFSDGDYLPLGVRGGKRRHVCAFARISGEDSVLVVAPRLTVGLTDSIQRPPIGLEVWDDTLLVLPRGCSGRQYRNLFTGEALSVSEQAGVTGLPLAAVLASFPVALLAQVTE